MGITIPIFLPQISQKGKNGSIVRILLPIFREKSSPTITKGSNVLGVGAICSKVRAVHRGTRHTVQGTRIDKEAHQWENLKNLKSGREAKISQYQSIKPAEEVLSLRISVSGIRSVGPQSRSQAI
jgi:hypothetical protein